MVKKQNWIFFLPLVVVIADQLSKFLVLKNIAYGQRAILIKNFLYLTNISNTGTLFGMFTGNNWIFVLITIIALFAIGYFFFKTKEQQVQIVLALVFGAAVGNLIDRLVFGSVVDFIRISFYPAVFNIADSTITVCIVWLVVYFINKESKDKKKAKK